ncbi:hypothetical protein [Methanococcus maripaludis]|uniref:Uncharacterized protein n=1 Tax=Methanococcus maripaludis TaxID=39152 RepID=A0A7J9PTF0_METMI|nr:hypothetical protein [Methanococcus maripaludis]MBA2868949.1 hypothetical protein [Methanococcus maripaludis]
MDKKILNYYNRKKHGINPENLKKAIDHDLNLYNNLNNKMMEYIKLVFTIYSLSIPVAYAFYSIYNEQFMVLAGILVMNFIISIILFEIMDLKITINYLVASNIVRIKLLKKDVYSTVYFLLPNESKYMILTLIMISMFLYIAVIMPMLTFTVTLTEDYMKLSSFALAICSFGLLYITGKKLRKTSKELKKLEKLDFS